LKADGNATFSLNEIADYTAYVPYEDYSATKPVHYGRTTMLLSPSVIGMLRLSFLPFRESVISLDGKYVGRQFIDNSMRDDMAIPAYWLLNLTASKSFPAGSGKLTFSGYVNNLLGHLYYASGWRWESYSPQEDSIYYGIGVYPQPPTTFMLKMSYSF
jgi:iron complex outermembrane receptor protein